MFVGAGSVVSILGVCGGGLKPTAGSHACSLAGTAASGAARLRPPTERRVGSDQDLLEGSKKNQEGRKGGPKGKNVHGAASGWGDRDGWVGGWVGFWDWVRRG